MQSKKPSDDHQCILEILLSFARMCLQNVTKKTSDGSHAPACIMGLQNTTNMLDAWSSDFLCNNIARPQRTHQFYNWVRTGLLKWFKCACVWWALTRAGNRKSCVSSNCRAILCRKRDVAMYGGFVRLGWAIWHSHLHLLHCFFCALVACGLFIRHRVEDTALRALGKPAINRRGVVYLTDDALTGMCNIAETVFVTILACKLYEHWHSWGTTSPSILMVL